MMLHRGLRRAMLLLGPLLVAGCASPEVPILGIFGPERMPSMRSLPAPPLPLDGLNGAVLAVQLTADGVLVCMSEERVHTSGDEAPMVNALAWSDLQLRSHGVGGSSPAAVRLHSLLQRTVERHPEAHFMLDIKLWAAGDWWPYLEDFSSALITLEADPTMRGRLSVACQVDALLLLLQARGSTLPLYRADADADHAMRRAVTSKYSGIVVQADAVTREGVKKAQGMGLRVALRAGDDVLAEWQAAHRHPAEVHRPVSVE